MSENVSSREETGSTPGKLRELKSEIAKRCGTHLQVFGEIREARENLRIQDSPSILFQDRADRCLTGSNR